MSFILNAFSPVGHKFLHAFKLTSYACTASFVVDHFFKVSLNWTKCTIIERTQMRTLQSLLQRLKFQLSEGVNMWMAVCKQTLLCSSATHHHHSQVFCSEASHCNYSCVSVTLPVGGSIFGFLFTGSIRYFCSLLWYLHLGLQWQIHVSPPVTKCLKNA